MEATTLLKETKINLLRDFTMLAPFQFHSKLLLALRTMQEVSTQLQTAERPLKMLTTQFWLQDMVLRRELNIGILRTLGVHHGVLKVTSKWKEESTCALLLNATHILLLTGSEISNQESLKNDSNEPIDLLKILIVTYKFNNKMVKMIKKSPMADTIRSKSCIQRKNSGLFLKSNSCRS